MTEHTPTPWRILPEEVDKDYIRIRGTRLGCRYKIANVLTPVYDSAPQREADETRANAEFIVRACNNHDNFVADKERAIGVMKMAEQTLAAFQYPDPIPPSNEWVSEMRGTLLKTIKHEQESLSKVKAVQS